MLPLLETIVDARQRPDCVGPMSPEESVDAQNVLLSPQLARRRFSALERHLATSPPMRGQEAYWTNGEVYGLKKGVVAPKRAWK